MATIQDVAKEAGVSVATVSYVLNGTRVMGEDAARRVREAAQRLNYRPNPYARGLRRRHVELCGVILASLSDSAELLQGLAEGMPGMALLLRETGFSPEREQAAVSELAAMGARCLVVESLDRRSVYPLPTLRLGLPGEGCAAFAAPDWQHHACLLAGHLRPFSACLLLARHSSHPAAAALEAQFSAPLRLAENAARAQDLVAELLHRGQEPDCIAAADEALAIGALAAVKDAGLEGTCRVAALSGGSRASLAGITAVNPFPYRMGAEGGQLLMAHLADPSLPSQQISSRGRLTVRPSTDPAAPPRWDLQGL